MKADFLKTIDIQAKEWFDKINGNSYFSAVITLNYGMKYEKTIKIPFTYGYGTYYEQESKYVLTELNYISPGHESLYSFCKRNNIILRSNKKEKCLKRELKH
jgi:hypothetical protein